jgi:ABC-type polysaccharide/polyol phosphate export permease
VPLQETSEDVRGFLKLNPLTGLFEAYRSIFLYGTTPAAWQLLYPLIAAAFLLAIFLPLYKSEERHFAKVI